MKIDGVRFVQLMAIGLTAIIFLLLTFLILRNQNQPPVQAIKPAPASLKVAGVKVGVVEVNRSSQVLTRPLFWASRRPSGGLPLKPEPKRKKAIDSFDKVRLLGIYNADEGSGLIVSGGKGVSQRLKLGDEIAGWKLMFINEKGGYFERNGQDRVLQIKRSAWFEAEAEKKRQSRKAGKQGA